MKRCGLCIVWGAALLAVVVLAGRAAAGDVAVRVRAVGGVPLLVNGAVSLGGVVVQDEALLCPAPVVASRVVVSASSLATEVGHVAGAVVPAAAVFVPAVPLTSLASVPVGVSTVDRVRLRSTSFGGAGRCWAVGAATLRRRGMVRQRVVRIDHGARTSRLSVRVLRVGRP